MGTRAPCQAPSRFNVTLDGMRHIPGRKPSMSRPASESLSTSRPTTNREARIRERAVDLIYRYPARAADIMIKMLHQLAYQAPRAAPRGCSR